MAAATQETQAAQIHEPADALSLCGTGTFAYEDPDGSTLIFGPTRCHRWDCKACGPFRVAAARDQARAGRPDRLLTLTTRPDDTQVLSEAIDSIRCSFRRLSQRVRRVFGPFAWFAGLELTKRGAPHLHVLTRGSYIPQRWLSQAWNSLTENPIVHITKIDKVARAIGETTKYLTKSAAQVQEQCPGRPVFTMSRDWLPEDYDDQEHDRPLDSSARHFRLDLDETHDIIHDLGGSLDPVPDSRHRYALTWHRKPTWKDFEPYLLQGAWHTVELVAWILWKVTGPEWPTQTFDDVLDDISFARFGDKSFRVHYVPLDFKE